MNIEHRMTDFVHQYFVASKPGGLQRVREYRRPRLCPGAHFEAASLERGLGYGAFHQNEPPPPQFRSDQLTDPTSSLVEARYRPNGSLSSIHARNCSTGTRTRPAQNSGLSRAALMMCFNIELPTSLSEKARTPSHYNYSAWLWHTKITHASGENACRPPSQPTSAFRKGQSRASPDGAEA